MRIRVLAAESLGVRSMCVEVECRETRLLIDPGAALGPRRYGLPPDQMEWRRLHTLRERIRKRLSLADTVIITHYHFDHYTPDWAEDLRGKRVLIKDPVRNINRSQARRAAEFVKRLSMAGVQWEVAEGRRLRLPGVEVHLSGPLWHGPETRFGCVMAVAVKEGGESFLHTSDVSGPVHPEILDFIKKVRPEVLLVDGPSTYLGPRYGHEALSVSRRNLISLVRDMGISILILEHHLLRDLGWRKWAEPIFEAATQKGTLVFSGAEFSGEKETLLEAERKKRYQK
ncbi:MBL fold metallo-hydrolase [Thermosulfurimonas sp. F29]|uniref:MBL fold metallo-hydrolase n=1 Tax=Thermosulfurimonas sp. F29 TaxID=2867247 RepID=UPI001C83054C|nr:MBL fold metallo-hydrolase [Thermosulfurimonas sp. F29]MBX6423251.1 MBL fold metallo-hydrolase [Thermosulfurimonas sp. F29]